MCRDPEVSRLISVEWLSDNMYWDNPMAFSPSFLAWLNWQPKGLFHRQDARHLLWTRCQTPASPQRHQTRQQQQPAELVPRGGLPYAGGNVTP